MDEVAAFLAGVEPPARRADAEALARIMGRVTGDAPRLWGTMVGFGERHYRYASGREGDTFRVGFAPRKSATVIYAGSGEPLPAEMLDALGKHKAGVGCVYLGRLADADPAALEDLIAWAYAPPS